MKTTQEDAGTPPLWSAKGGGCRALIGFSDDQSFSDAEQI
jgi:hypothetical protein